MKKSYSVNGVVYDFTDVHEECGMLNGMCLTPPYYGNRAWLDSHSFQLEGYRRVEAREVVEPSRVDNSYTVWGGELRDRLPRGARYYRKGAM